VQEVRARDIGRVQPLWSRSYHAFLTTASHLPHLTRSLERWLAVGFQTMNIVLVHGILGFREKFGIEYFRGVAEHLTASRDWSGANVS
jgi:hypothetical protein